MRRSVFLLHGRLQIALGTSVHAGPSGPLLDLGVEVLPMVPSNNLYYDAAKLRQRLDTDGYLYFKRMIPKEVIHKAYMDLAGQVHENQWTTESDIEAETAENGVVAGLLYPRNLLKSKSPPPPPKVGFQVTKPVGAAVGGSNVMSIARQIFGGGVQRYDHVGMELSYPGEASGFSSSSVLLTKGSPLVVNAWVPLHDMPLSMGGLAVVVGSNSSEQYANVRKTYGTHDAESSGIAGDGTLTHDPYEILYNYSFSRPGVDGRKSFAEMSRDKVRTIDYAAEVSEQLEEDRIKALSSGQAYVRAAGGQGALGTIATTAFDAGDVVLTTVYTLQGFTTNRSRYWRMSGVSRWLMEGDDIGPDPRWMGPTAGQTHEAWMSRPPAAGAKSMAEAKQEWGLPPWP